MLLYVCLRACGWVLYVFVAVSFERVFSGWVFGGGVLFLCC